MRREATKYPGVFRVKRRRIGAKGEEWVYHVRFKVDGKDVEAKAGRQYANAMTPAKAARIRQDMIEGRRLTPPEKRRKKAEKRWTLDELWKAYDASKADRKDRGNDLCRYNKHIRPHLGGKRPKDLVAMDVDRLRLHHLKGLAPATVRSVLELFRRITNFGFKAGLTPRLGFSFKLPRVNNQRTEMLSEAELARLWHILETDSNRTVADMMKMALLTGMRRGEIMRLKWRDVDFERGFIHLRDPKGGVDQTIPLPPQAREMLDGLPRQSEWVFPGGGANGQRVEVAKVARRILTSAGLPESFRPFHGLRHAYASMLASSGQVDIYTLQKLLTHKSPAMTQRYAHLHDQALQRAATVAGKLIKEAGSPKVVNLEDHRGK
jgi:integrase